MHRNRFLTLSAIYQSIVVLLSSQRSLYYELEPFHSSTYVVLSVTL